MHIPWLFTRAPLHIMVQGLKTEPKDTQMVLSGMLKLRARRSVRVKTTALRVFGTAPPPAASHQPSSLSNHAVILDRSLSARECIEMPIHLLLPAKLPPSNSPQTLTLSVEIATEPDRPRSEWSGEFTIHSP